MWPETLKDWDFFVLFLRWEGRELRSLASPLQVSLVKGRLGTFPNYSALYLKKKLWWNGFFTAIGVFAEQELKSNVLRDHKSSFWDEPIKQLNTVETENILCISNALSTKLYQKPEFHKKKA